MYKHVKFKIVSIIHFKNLLLIHTFITKLNYYVKVLFMQRLSKMIAFIIKLKIVLYTVYQQRLKGGGDRGNVPPPETRKICKGLGTVHDSASNENRLNKNFQIFVKFFQIFIKIFLITFKIFLKSFKILLNCPKFSVIS